MFFGWVGGCEGNGSVVVGVMYEVYVFVFVFEFDVDVLVMVVGD